MTNILITSASRKVLLVRAFQEALAAHGGGKVIAVDVSPLAPALYLADEHFLVPRSSAPEFLETMVRLCRSQTVKLLVPTRDEELPLFAEQAARFATVGTRVLVSSPETVRTCQDKRLFIEFCLAHGFETPRLVDPAEQAAPHYPLFVKPRFGKGSLGTGRVETSEELTAILARHPEAIVQENVEAPEYTIDLFADFDGRIISVVPRQRVRTFGGESVVSRTCALRPLMEQPAALARALGLVGHNTIQCFLDGEAVRFIEVNPRFGGAANLSFAAGAPTPSFLIRLLNGETLQPCIGEHRTDYVMLRYSEDLFLEAGALTGRKSP